MNNASIKKRISAINAKIEKGADIAELKKMKRLATTLKRLYLENTDNGKEDDDLALYHDIVTTIDCIEEFLEQ